MRESTRKGRKMLRSFFLVLVASIAMVLAYASASQDNVGEEPKQEPPVQSTEPALVVQRTESLGEFAIVAYCSCEACCGRWAVDRPLDESGKEIIYTASGARAEAGVTVAVDPDVIPLGTKVHIDGMGWYVAQDTGAFTGKVIDVYFDSHEAACEFGRRDAEVSVVTADG